MIKVSLTPELDCSYIDGQQEQLLIVRDELLFTDSGYDTLLHNGFRRSGNDIYRPHCNQCQACQSVRINTAQFKPSKSQKRLLKKNKDLVIIYSKVSQPNYYALYEQYINTLHTDGAMYPATIEQYQGFIGSLWLEPLFIEIYDNNRLIAVSVTDTLPNSMSAMYCFYHPDYPHRSLGTFAILQQIELAKQRHKQWLYLGYQIDACKKMKYKTNFHPHERLIAGKWCNQCHKADK